MKNVAIFQHYRTKKDFSVHYNHYENSLNKFISTLFKDAQCNFFDVINGQYPRAINDYDLYLLPGSSASACHKTPWIQEECRMIEKLHAQQKPMLGLCFGHQIISKALGGMVKKSPFPWQGGIKSYDIVGQHKWIEPVVTIINAHASHDDYVIKKPNDARIFAQNEQCPIAGFTIQNHILSFQLHPEIDHIMMKRFIKMRLNLRLNTEEELANAKKSLTGHTDQKKIHQWIKAFFNKEG